MLKGMLALNRSSKRIPAAIILILIVSPILMSVDLPETTGHPVPVETFAADGPLGQASNWTNDTRLTYEPDISATPDLAVEGDNLHLVWADFRYGSHYVYAIPPFDTPRTVSYSVNALDFVKNYNSTPLYSFEVTAQDTIPPDIELEPIASRMIGRETTIEAIVRDNSRVEAVRLDYVDVLGNRFNVSMNLYEDDPKYYFTYRATISPQSQEGIITYFVWAIDAEGITNMTEEYTVSVQSNDSNPPMSKHDPPRTRMFGYEVNIEAKVLDDAEVEIAGLDYVDVEGVTHNVTMFSRGNHTYSFGMLPQPFTGTLNHSIWARDVNGNENRTPTFSIQIVSVDNELPAIVHSPIKSAVIGYWVPIHAFVTDNFGLWTANLSIDGGQIMLGQWSTDGSMNLYYKRSMDGGKTWDDGLGHVGVDRPLTRWGSNDGPRISVEGNNVHVLFIGTDPPGIYYMVSRDNGRMWSAPRMLADLGGGEIAVHGDSVYVVWADMSTPPEPRLLHITFSTDGGRTWPYKGILNRTLNAGPPRIALDGQYLHVLVADWDDIYIRYMRGKWNGNGFIWDDGMGREGEARIVGSNDARVWWPPQGYAITASGGKVHVVYRKEVYHITRKLWCDGFEYDFITPYLQLIHNGST
ncbi:MAG: exo-alpha-sialidase, partial [Thermoplasmata archaeon]|nr:exo-alpha-sialidase [Thermoplasmata archaeon]